MTKKLRTEIEKSLRRKGVYKFPCGDYIVQIDKNEYSLRNGETHNTITVDKLDNILELCE